VLRDLFAVALWVGLMLIAAPFVFFGILYLKRRQG